jgi:prephenate dehydratase
VSTQPRPRVAFQGERGAFSEEAAVKLLGEEIELVPRTTFATLFTSVDEGVADLILAPVENSTAGVVQAAVDQLNASSLVTIDQVTIPVVQHLIACPNATMAEVKTVQSHPMALAQCTKFFAAHPELRQEVADDTAGSVAEVIRRGDRTVAAIAGRRAAEIYGGMIIEERIQDSTHNYTRFVLLSAQSKET